MTTAEQLQWLVDRAQISDLLIEFARALDDGDADAYAATYTEDGGDVARTRSYMLAVHRHSDDPADHATGSGWYENTLRRTPEGWRFTVARVHVVWRSGTGPLPGEATVTEATA